MTSLPPSPFFNPGATDCPPAEATASSRQSYDAVVDIPAPRFLIDEESFLYAINPPPLPLLFIGRAMFELSRQGR
jgi:hypothetical protein